MAYRPLLLKQGLDVASAMEHALNKQRVLCGVVEEEIMGKAAPPPEVQMLESGMGGLLPSAEYLKTPPLPGVFPLDGTR